MSPLLTIFSWNLPVFNFRFLQWWHSQKFSEMSSGLVKINCYKYIQCIRIIFSPKLIACSCTLNLYGGFDAWPINTEFLGMTFIAIFGVGNIPEHGISLKYFKHAMIFWQNVDESCTFQKIYGVGKVKLQTE